MGSDLVIGAPKAGALQVGVIMQRKAVCADLCNPVRYPEGTRR